MGVIMEYSISQLSNIAGISARTLRYYDEIGLLKPSRVSDTGYRYYGAKEVDLLQQILFFRERGISLDKITNILYQEGFDKVKVLKEHLSELQKQRNRLDGLIDTVELTLAAMKGEIKMSDSQKFANFKKEAIEENELKYGKEVRERYGDETVDASNRKMLKMTEEEYKRFQQLGEEIIESLQKAVLAGEKPEDEEGKRIAGLHKEWLCFTWGQYSKEAHDGLVDMYIADERFTKFYDKEVSGCARFLADAVHFVKKF